MVGRSFPGRRESDTIDGERGDLKGDRQSATAKKSSDDK